MKISRILAFLFLMPYLSFAGTITDNVNNYSFGQTVTIYRIIITNGFSMSTGATFEVTSINATNATITGILNTTNISINNTNIIGAAIWTNSNSIGQEPTFTSVTAQKGYFTNLWVDGAISQTVASVTNVFMGRVGIGTNGPASELHIRATNGNAGVNIAGATTTDGGGILFRGGTTIIGQLYMNPSGSYLDYTNFLAIRNQWAGTEVARFTSEGALSIASGSTLKLGPQSWTNLYDSTNNTPYFIVGLTTNQTACPSGTTNLSGQTAGTDNFSGWTNSTQRYYIPRTGWWLITVNYFFGIDLSGGGAYQVYVYNNSGVIVMQSATLTPNNGTAGARATHLLYFTQGQYIYIALYLEKANQAVYGSSVRNAGYFAGQWLHY